MKTKKTSSRTARTGKSRTTKAATAKPRRSRGRPRAKEGSVGREAIVASAKVRLRPILMTTAAMVLGVVPLIVSSGAGAAARYSMGLVIFTGILVGTMFTLFVVPMFYTFIASKEKDLTAGSIPAWTPGATVQLGR
jgi:preprotein translocase subunit SecF